MEWKLIDSEKDLLINLWQQERCLWKVSTPLYASKDATKVTKKRVDDAIGATEGKPVSMSC